MKPLGVAEIVLNVSDMSRMRSFYIDVMGFELNRSSRHENGPRAEPGGEPTICFLDVDSRRDTPLAKHGHPLFLVLIDHRRHFFARQRFTGRNTATSTLNHLAFEVELESFAARLAFLEEHSISTTVTEFPDLSARAIFFHDPEGNVLEWIAHDPGMGDGA